MSVTKTKQNLNISGGMIVLTGVDKIPTNDISSVEFKFSCPIKIIFSTNISSKKILKIVL